MPFGTLKFYCNAKYNALISRVLKPIYYKNKFANETYNVFIVDEVFSIDSSYRAVQMLKGLYLGHNCGPKCYLHIDKNNIYIHTSEKDAYSKIIWSFVLKYVFTKVSLDNNVLHLKSLMLRTPKNHIMLILGKGRSGKTTLAHELNRFGYKIASNTHCFWKDNYVWGINSWIRKRDSNGLETYTYVENSERQLEGLCDNYLILDRSLSKKTTYFSNEILKPNDAYFYIKNFSAALGNYDLKEEIWDYYSSDFYEKISYFEKESQLIKQLIEANDVYKIDLEAFNESSIYGFSKYFNK